MDAVLLDTCVLLKSYLCDTLLSIAEVGTFRPLWSDHVLEELRRNLVKAGAKPEAVEHRLGQMAAYFPDARVTGYEQLIGSMTNHPKDRHVLAAAVAGRAGTLVTEDLKTSRQNRPCTWASPLPDRTTSYSGCLSCTRTPSWTRSAASHPATGASPDRSPRS
jgi:predicted nucleic acid-binding protein